MVAQKRLRVEPAAMHVQKKTAIELEMEEAEEYERRKETEQRRPYHCARVITYDTRHIWQ